jgi:hypothetical protein
VDELDRQVKEQVEIVEQAMRDIRGTLRERREGPVRERNEQDIAHRNELARIAYRLKIQGVTNDIIAHAFGAAPVGAQRMVTKGEILVHGGRTRNERMDELKDGATLWEAGLFSNRVNRVLQRNGINTLDELCRKEPQELVSFPNFGMRSLREVDQVLAEMGRRLGDTDDGVCEEDERVGSEEQDGGRADPSSLRSHRTTVG